MFSKNATTNGWFTIAKEKSAIYWNTKHKISVKKKTWVTSEWFTVFLLTVKAETLQRLHDKNTRNGQKTFLTAPDTTSAAVLFLLCSPDICLSPKCLTHRTFSKFAITFILLTSVSFVSVQPFCLPITLSSSLSLRCSFISLQALKINQAVEIEESKTHRGHFYINGKEGGVGGCYWVASFSVYHNQHEWL